MRRYVLLFFVCIAAIAACSPRYYHGEQAAVAFKQEHNTETASVQKWMEEYMHKALQEWKNMQEWTDQVSVKEVMSEPDSAGVQHVKERITTTTHHHLESSAGSQEDTSTILKEKTDSVGTEENHNAAYTEQKKTVAGKVDGIMPWYVYLAAIIAALVIGFVLARKKGWFAIKA